MGKNYKKLLGDDDLSCPFMLMGKNKNKGKVDSHFWLL